MRRILVLLSGGMDSATALALAVETAGRENVQALSIFYGQRHERELLSANEIARHYNVPHRVLFADGVFDTKASALTNEEDIIPHMSYAEMGTGPTATYVPVRNPILLSIAAHQAMAMKCNEVWCGIHAEDSSNDAYPDCQPECFLAMRQAIFIGSYGCVRLLAPFLHDTKRDIARLGYNLGVPFCKTYSCYEGNFEPCGKCATCIAREEALKDIDANI
jgi:7-cyano-7-deazaguanine synthase